MTRPSDEAAITRLLAEHTQVWQRKRQCRMDVPTDAIEAAAEALHDLLPGMQRSNTFGGPRIVSDELRERARVALSAAMPAIREAIAQEIEAIPYSPELEHGDNGEWMQTEAARVVREGAK